MKLNDARRYRSNHFEQIFFETTKLLALQKELLDYYREHGMNKLYDHYAGDAELLEEAIIAFTKAQSKTYKAYFVQIKDKNKYLQEKEHDRLRVLVSLATDIALLARGYARRRYNFWIVCSFKERARTGKPVLDALSLMVSAAECFLNSVDHPPLSREGHILLARYG